MAKALFFCPQCLGEAKNYDENPPPVCPIDGAALVRVRARDHFEAGTVRESKRGTGVVVWKQRAQPEGYGW